MDRTLFLAALAALLMGCPADDPGAGGDPDAPADDQEANDDDSASFYDDDDDATSAWDDDDAVDDDDAAPWDDDDDACQDDDDVADDDDDAWDDDDATSDDDDAASDDDDAVSDDDDATADDDDATADDDDASPEDGEDITCLAAVEQPTTWYVSADDSNSQADAAHLRSLIEADAWLSSFGPFRPYEIFNYYDWDYPAAPPNELVVDAQLRPSADDPEVYMLAIGVTSEAMSAPTRPDLNLVLSLDTSCSMGGFPMDAEREVARAIASQLREGDTLSMVEWSSSTNVLLDGHAVTGNDDPLVASLVDGLIEGGGTDLAGGLVRAYSLAQANYDPAKLNRVVIVSDGGANMGVTSGQLIGANAADSEAESIYLVGVGTGEPAYYNDDLMNDVTDLGKGAYVYIDDEPEAWTQFTGEHFLQNLAVTAREVQLEMTLPEGFAVERFYGEQISQDQDEVEPQNIAPNDTMMFVQTVRDCSADAASGALEFAFTVTWQDAQTGALDSASFVATLDEMLGNSARQLEKVRALTAYVDAANDVWTLPPAQQGPYMDAAWATVNDVLGSFPTDADLQEVLYLTGRLRARF